MEDLKQSGIYQITNKINGKIYIGQSVNIHNRWSSHCRPSKRKQQTNISINRAIEKYGITNFEFSVIEFCAIELLNEREIYWIKEKYSKTPNGYNLTLGGDGVKGFKMSQEGKDKLSNALKGRIRTKDHSENISKAKKGKKQ